MEFISEQEAHKIDQFRRKSRFVSEFRSRLTRIPLKMRSMSTEREGSFVMIASTKDAQYRKPNSSVIRKKRTVTEWARKKNISDPIKKFEKANELPQVAGPQPGSVSDGPLKRQKTVIGRVLETKLKDFGGE